MLWKNKKIYQDTTEGVVSPPSEITVYLNNVRGVFFGDTESDPLTTVVQYILAGDVTNTVISENLTYNMTPSEPYDELVVNECIKDGSLYVGGVNITNESPTVVPYWSITADFGTCP